MKLHYKHYFEDELPLIHYISKKFRFYWIVSKQEFQATHEEPEQRASLMCNVCVHA